MTEFEKTSLFNTILIWEEDYGRDMICAIIADRYNIGDDEHGVSADELVDLVSAGDLEATKELMANELDQLDDEYQGDMSGLLSVMKEYLCSDGDDSATTPKTTAPNNAANLSSAPATAPAPMPAPTPAPATTAVPAQPVQNQPSIPQMVVQPTRVRNYANITADSFAATFDTFAELRDCVADMESDEEVFTHDEDRQAAGIGFDPTQPNIHIEAIENMPIAAGSLAQKMKSTPDAVLDTMTDHGGTGLAIKMGDRLVPIGWAATAGMCDRAGFTNDGFMRHFRKSSEDAASAFNRQFSNGKGGVTLITRAGKLRAMNSRNFAYGKYSDILDVYETFKSQKFPLATEQGLYIDHMRMRWEMNLSMYKDDILKGFSGLYNAGYYPVLQFGTSNTTNSAFRIMPALGHTGSDIVVPLCRVDEAISVRHVAPGNYSERINNLMERIVDSFRGCGTMMDAANRNVEALHGITVINAYNALLRTMSDCNIPKKQGMEAATAFKNFHGTNSATAFECFMAIVNAYSYVARDYPANQEIQFTCALNVGRAVGAPWEARGNIPGDFAW